ncbi:MAG: hypothetical protein ABSD92_07025 [Candidatus Bathyarchaeia archaeon]
MVEKKVILCAILAIALGIATIVPLEYMMAAQAQANSQTAEAQTKANAVANVQATIEPLSNINVTYAYCNPNNMSSNDIVTLYGAELAAVVNFTLTPGALGNADAQIEYYQFAVSSDQGPILNMSYYLVEAKNENIVTGIGGPEGTINFANGLTYNGPASSNGQGINLNVWDGNYTMGYVGDLIGSDPNNPPQAAAELRNATTLYIDVTKTYTVTVSGNVTVTTPASNQVLQHIVLTNLGNGLGFVYGTYVDGTLPLPPALTGPATNQTATSSGQAGNYILASP